MKKIILMSMLAVLVFACGNKSDESSSQKYGIESGIITYKNNMMGMEFTITQYFKEHGDVEAVTTEVNMMGQKNVQHSLRKEGYYYSYNEGQAEGAKFKLDNLKDSTDNGKMTEELILKKGGKKVGTEKVLDKECTIYEVTVEGSVTKIWLWKNIMLKMVATQGEMEVVMEATELNETSDFPQGVFDVPANIQFKEMSDQDMNFEDPEAEG